MSSLEEWAATKKCCCPHPDAYQCVMWRYPGRMEDRSCDEEPCECGCHDSPTEEEGEPPSPETLTKS